LDREEYSCDAVDGQESGIIIFGMRNQDFAKVGFSAAHVASFDPTKVPTSALSVTQEFLSRDGRIQVLRVSLKRQ
jgi:hypothetical protein